MEKKFYTEPESMIVLLDKDDTIATSWENPTYANGPFETAVDLTTNYELDETSLPEGVADISSSDIGSFSDSSFDSWN